MLRKTVFKDEPYRQCCAEIYDCSVIRIYMKIEICFTFSIVFCLFVNDVWSKKH